jgi:Methylase involved in ubiquinone/menaquinone biosynthesis
VIDEGRWLSFEARADEYRTARPPYPETLYEILEQRCGLGPGSRVLEIGAGTGQATRGLLARGATVVAVEPGVRLAAHLAADVGGDALEVVNDMIETAPLPDASFDIVASATAFHWVRSEIALPRLARALRPGGWLAVWWTVFGDRTRPTPFRAALDRLYERNFPHAPRDPVLGPLNIESWRDELSQGGWFTRPDVEQIRWENRLTPDGARRLFGSFPNVNELDPDRRAAHLDAIADLVREAGGVVLDPCVTVLYLARQVRAL